MTKLFKKLPLIAMITLVMLISAATSIKADGTATRTETVCDSGSYGTQNCHEVVITIPTHTVVGTAIPNLDLLIVAVGSILILSGAAYIYTK